MWMQCRLFWFMFLLGSGMAGLVQRGDDLSPEDEGRGRTRREVIDDEMKKQVQLLLEHFKQDDPIGVPSVPIPDPISVPDFHENFRVISIDFLDTKVHGLSKFRIVHVTADLAAMKLSLALSIDNLYILGTYVARVIWSTSGPFNMTLEGVLAEAVVTLEVGQNGVLKTQDVSMDVQYRESTLKFEDVGFFGSIIQGILNSVVSVVFYAVKDSVLGQASEQVRTVVDDGIRDFSHRFPDSVSTVDVMLANVKSEIRDNDLDPVSLPKFYKSSGTVFPVSVELVDGELRGLATIHRTGNISVAYRDGAVHVGFSVGLQKVTGQYAWSVQFGFSRSGQVRCSVESVEIRVELSQSTNVDKSPRLEKLDISAGRFQVRSSGAGTMDYVIEFLFNVIPNTLENLIMEAVEIQVTKLIQKHLDELDIEKIIREQMEMEK